MKLHIDQRGATTTALITSFPTATSSTSAPDFPPSPGSEFPD